MGKIYVVRHGEDEDNANRVLNGRHNSPLTVLGRQQANQLAERIQKNGITFDVGCSSPLERAYQTAIVITEKLRLKPPTILNDLIERNLGEMTGRPFEEMRTMPLSNLITLDPFIYFLSAKGAETFPMLLDRARRVIQSIIPEAQKEGSILLVTHGQIGKMLYASYYNIDWQEILTKFYFENA